MVPSGEAAPIKVKKHPVIEIFGPVIQGEGSQAGQQTLFLRFGGCDYRCSKCDSLFAVLPEAVVKNARWLTPDEIVAECLQFKNKTGVNWITFSGGNPCMHKLNDLVDQLTDAGFLINVETQGTLWQSWLYQCTMVTVSPKSPGMGEKFEEAKYRRFISRLNGIMPVCIKVVAFSAQDLEFALTVYAVTEDAKKDWLYTIPGAVAYYLSQGNAYPPRLDDEMNLQPGWDEVDMAKQLLSDYRFMCEELLPDPRLKMFRFLPQIHVLVYGNEASR